MQKDKFNFTRKEARDYAGISDPTFRKWTNTPGFPVIHAGKKLLIPIERFKRWMEEQAGGEGR